jgi:hypothetical protein
MDLYDFLSDPTSCAEAFAKEQRSDEGLHTEQPYQFINTGCQ